MSGRKKKSGRKGPPAPKRSRSLREEWNLALADAMGHFVQGDVVKAFGALDRARSLAERIRREELDPVPLAATSMTLSEAAVALDRHEEGAEAARCAFEIFQTLPDAGSETIDAALALGNHLRELESPECLEWYDRAIGKIEAEFSPDDMGVGYALLGMADAATSLGLREAELPAILDRALGFAFKDRWGTDLYEIGTGVANVHANAGRFDRALEIAGSVFEEQKRLYALPESEPMEASPDWPNSEELVAAAEGRSEFARGIEPGPLLEVRLMLASLLNRLDRGDEAAVHLDEIDKQLAIAREDAGLGGCSDPGCGCHAEGEEVEDLEDEDEDFEEEDEDFDDGDEDFDEDDDMDDPYAEWRGLDPVALAMQRGQSLVFVAAKTRDRSLLDRALEKFREALALGEEGYGEPEQVEELRELIERVEEFPKGGGAAQ